MTTLKLLFLAAALATACGAAAQNPANYRPAVYPQQQTTAGSAVLDVLTQDDGITVYGLKNDIIDARFVKGDGKLTFGGSTTMNLLAGTELFTVKFGTNGTKVVNASQMTLADVSVEDLVGDAKAIRGAEHYDGKRLVATYNYKYSTANVTIVWTAELRDGSHYVKTDVTISADKNVRMFAVVPMQYSVDVAASGVEAPAPVGYQELRGRIVASDKIFACLDTPTAINTATAATTSGTSAIQGLWSRDTTLEKGQTWKVGSVVGLLAPEEDRRSVLAFVERERAVPWRPFPIYNSWYELNIDRTNKNHDPAMNMKVEQTVDVLKQWKKHMFDTQGVSIKAFVWDDGWDQYGTWDFNAGFPNGFSEPDVVARQMCSGLGAWLGPCGGYDVAGDERKAYWTRQGLQCNLYNKKYYDVFVGACSRMVEDYEFRYFKFDGISTLSPAYGPAAGTKGEEDCEGIISVEKHIRSFKPDIFFNTTVGTWASPLWFTVSDAVWRHHNDHGYAGSNSNSREKWITYRDQYVYQHYVKENPLMTINSMMTHGLLLSNHGGPNGMPKDYASVLREMRCAFACGSGQVELYCDYDLLNSIQKDASDPKTAGALWQDLADLIKWQRKNADVLPDIHWVGGDPASEEVYGWAAWNGNKAVFSLRNGKAASQTFEITLRQALGIPQSVKTSITFAKPFADQKNLSGLTVGQPIDIDQKLKVTLPASTVYMFDGIDANGHLVPVADLHFEQPEIHVPAGRAVAPEYVVAPLDASDRTLSWTSADTDIATVNDGAITGVMPGETTVTAEANDGSGLTMSIKVIVDVNLQNDLEQLIEQVQTAYDANDDVVLGDALITKTTQFSSPNSDSQEGKSFPLLDGKADTFWHSDWHAGDQKPHSHYLQVTLPEAVEGTIQATVMRRLNGTALCANDNPVVMGVEVSADGRTFTSAGQMDLPYGDKVVCGTFECTEPTKYFRFWNDKSNNLDRGYWHVGDFQLNPIVRESINGEFPDAAAALLAALADARKVHEADETDIALLNAAYAAYLAAISNTPDGISAATAPSATSAPMLYDLQGRRVSTTAKGVYIIDGKRVIR